MKIEKLKIKNYKGGYTIIETMISISIFLILIMIGMTTLMNAFSVHKKSQNMRSEMDNLSFILEDMSRNMRTATQYHCIDNSNSDFSNIGVRRNSPVDGGGVRQLCWGIAFEAAGGDEASTGDQWVYYINGGKIYKTDVNDLINAIPLTPDEVVLNPVSGFYIFGAEAEVAPNKQQPFIKIILAGNVLEKGVNSPFSLETLISSRVIDNFY